jgi:hypothetical protein
MSDTTEHPAATAIRASDADRDQVTARLQRHYAEGRLTLPELEERAAAAYAARTREQLRALTADLQSDPGAPAQPDTGPDPCLLCLLLCVCPPAGVAYWLLSRRKDRAADPPTTSSRALLPPHTTRG